MMEHPPSYEKNIAREPDEERSAMDNGLPEPTNYAQHPVGRHERRSRARRDQPSDHADIVSKYGSEDKQMGIWTDTVEFKATIIREQLATARSLAERNGADPDEVAKPYLKLLEDLYREELGVAQLADASDSTKRPSKQ